MSILFCESIVIFSLCFVDVVALKHYFSFDMQISLQGNLFECLKLSPIYCSTIAKKFIQSKHMNPHIRMWLFINDEMQV